MHSRSPTSADCVFRHGTACSHVAIRAETDDLKCGACSRYRGRARGMGDVVHSALHAVGIGQLVEHAAKTIGADCGCKERRAALNAAMPFTDEPKRG